MVSKCPYPCNPPICQKDICTTEIKVADVLSAAAELLAGKFAEDDTIKIVEAFIEFLTNEANKGMLLLEEVAALVNNISDMNMQIASAAEEQSSVSEEINRNVINISDEAQKNSQNSQQTQNEINQLEEFSSYLNTLVAQFVK